MAETLAEQLAALERERARLEQFLMLDANWRALRQLDEREAAGQPLEAIDGGELRAALERALAANRIYSARSKMIEAIALLSGTGPAEHGANGDARKQLSSLRPRPAAIASRIVMLPEGAASSFKARLKVKSVLAGLPQTQGANGQAAAALAPGEPPTSTPRSGEPTARAEETTVVQAPVVEPPGPTAAAPGSPAATTNAPVEPARASTDRLDLIAGLDPQAIARLAMGGVTSCSQIAAWTATDARHWRRRLADCTVGPAIVWIEQAAVLSSGRRTRHAERCHDGELDCLVATPAPEPPPAPVALPPPLPNKEPDKAPAVPVPAPAVPMRVILIDAEEPAPMLDRGAREHAAAAEATAATRPLEALPEAAPRRVIVIEAEELPPASALDRGRPDPDRNASGKGPGIAQALAEVRGERPVKPAEAETVVEIHKPDPEPPLQTSAAADAGERAVSAKPLRSGAASLQSQISAPKLAPVPANGSLLSRLRARREPATFDGSSYAAYHGAVEEASVTIVRAAEPSPTSDMPPPRPDEDRPASVSRFLRALTGKP